MTDIKITGANLIEQIRTYFPELERSYQEQAPELEDEGGKLSNYLFIGNVFKPMVEEELESGKITPVLERCAAFIERVCIDDDLEAVNAIWIRIFECLIFRPTELHTIWPILGTATKANIRDAARRWSEAGRYYGKTANLPEANIPDRE